MSNDASNSSQSGPELIYGIDDIPPVGQSITLGLQHYLTMFGSTVAIPFILSQALGMTDPREIGLLIGTMFFVSGITTLLQTTFGNRLPIVQGGTFSFLGPTFAICTMAALANQGWELKMRHVQGAIIVGSLVQMTLGYSGLIGKLRRFISPIVIAPTIALIGLALFDVGANTAGSHWGMAGLTIVLIVLFSQYLRKTHKAFELYPILLAIVLAWGVAALLTAVGVFEEGHAAHVSTANLEAAPWVRVPYPFQWGWPAFSAAAIVGMFAGFLASMIESIGDYYACARLSGAPVPDEKIINRGIGMEGVGCMVAGIFGTGNGTTSYSENIGAIGLTRVGSRRVVQIGAVIMLVLGVIGKFGALFTTIPAPIVGGMYCAMFGVIVAVGLSNLQFVNLNSPRNLFILGFSFFMGIAVPYYFKQDVQDGLLTAVNPIQFEPVWLASILNTIGSTGMAVAAIIALILDNTIPGTPEERGLTAWLSEGESTDQPDRWPKD